MTGSSKDEAFRAFVDARGRALIRCAYSAHR